MTRVNLKSAPTFFILSGLVFFVMSCNEYTSLVEREMATKVRNDSLILNLQFGMTKREFYAHCWELNKKGFVKEGLNNATVHFQIENQEKKYDVNFYPTFQDGKITSLPVEYSYTVFSPWNAKYSLDILLKEILDIYKANYGDDFLKIESEERGMAYVRVDGNRRISLFKNLNRNSVTALYFDLTSKVEADPIQ